MALLHDLKVNGTSIQTYAVVVEDLGGLFTRPPLRGSNFTLPGVDGELWVAKPRAAYGFSIGVAVLPLVSTTGADETTLANAVKRWTTNWRALMTVLGDGSAPLTLTRVLSTVAGTVTETCSAEVTGSIAPTMIGPTASRAVIDFWNLSGGWTEVP